jgi:hypothetical protein
VNINADSNEMREKLMQSLRLALSNQDVTDVDEADQLLAEITGESDSDDDEEALLYELDAEVDVVVDSSIDDGDGLVNSSFGETHAPPTPKNEPLPTSATLHSIPHTGSDDISNPYNVQVTNPSESNTYVSTSKNPNIETPPLSVSNENG